MMKTAFLGNNKMKWNCYNLSLPHFNQLHKEKKKKIKPADLECAFVSIADACCLMLKHMHSLKVLFRQGIHNSGAKGKAMYAS